jgi:hypothetical protein
MDLNSSDSKLLFVPRGHTGLKPLELDMTAIYRAESRINELAYLTPMAATELRAVFNSSANDAAKYLAWVEHELNVAKKYFDLARATVILDKAPDEFQKVKDKGIKFNEDFRDALVARDHTCSELNDKIMSLNAIKAFIEAKLKTFIRSYYAAESIAENKSRIAASPNLSASVGETNFENLMGIAHSDKF